MYAVQKSKFYLPSYVCAFLSKWVHKNWLHFSVFPSIILHSHSFAVTTAWLPPTWSLPPTYSCPDLSSHRQSGVMVTISSLHPVLELTTLPWLYLIKMGWSPGQDHGFCSCSEELKVVKWDHPLTSPLTLIVTITTGFCIKYMYIAMMKVQVLQWKYSLELNYLS